ncbi:hypothetical protein JQ631_10035 [Bradyrhizobium manausense]|jgi:hypothetical protein|uniref:hypothetical protein n=1 Tax=Bradyrhizobium manausense TaxID=989370 RepID=UPI001BA4717C|nr:hypothetical protein [Bradyrhizobium manausense]MBR0789409.1 hypothetical protein [Bradyrhizobium manausense]
MSRIINFPQRPKHLHPAVTRLHGLAAVLSDLDTIDLQSKDDLRRALWLLDLTNRCIQIILSDFSKDPCISELANRAEDLTAAIERARQMVRELDQVGLKSPLPDCRLGHSNEPRCNSFEFH